ncbi:MAG: hypothetical protein AB7S26_02135 [Sandaracinaceae bacterium]
MVLALSFGASFLGACQVYDPNLVDAGHDAGPPVACDLRRPPERPAMPDGDDGLDHLFGMRDVVLDQEEEWRNIGFDLDGRCTVEPNYDTECVPPRRRTPPADGNGGIDNSFGENLFPLVDVAVMGLEDTAHSADVEGTMPVVRVRGWNGMDDDARVDVAFSTAIFTVPNDGSDAPVPFDIIQYKPFVVGTTDMQIYPVYDGTDYAFLRDDTFFEGNVDRPLIGDDNAYIANRVVVARLPDAFEIVFPSRVAGVVVRLSDAIAVARISDDGMNLENATVAGRWRVLDLLSTAENVGLCSDNPQYDILTGTLDAIADIRSQPGTGGPGVMCDAVSIGVTFTGYRVRYGGTTSGPDVVSLCDLPDGGLHDGGAGGSDAGGGMDAGVDGG